MHPATKILIFLSVAFGNFNFLESLVYETYIKPNACNSGTTMFVCDPINFTSKCVSLSKYMDCKIDCNNAMDEECHDGFHKCDGCKCAPAENFKDICLDRNVSCLMPNTTKCKTGDVCVLNNWLLDGEKDCDDGSDEDPCFLKLPCCINPRPPRSTISTTMMAMTTTTIPTTTTTTTTTTTMATTSTITTTTKPPPPVTIDSVTLADMGKLSSLKPATCNDCNCTSIGQQQCSVNTTLALPQMSVATCHLYYQSVISGVFQCKNGNGCVLYKFAMDGIFDCLDHSDEDPRYWNECLLNRDQCDKICFDDVNQPDLYSPDGKAACKCPDYGPFGNTSLIAYFQNKYKCDTAGIERNGTKIRS